MRFIEHGPDIPDELLLALDEGKVMFFCGAGVSQAKAELPGFLDLAETVLKDLGASQKGLAYRILKSIPKIDKQVGASGLISVDRVFSELRKKFSRRDMEISVAKALKPQKGACLKAHKIILKLATTKDGHTRLVTTNFDRLFEKCKRGIKTWQPPRFPDLTEIDKFEGVVYLHGMVNKEYDNSDNGFVLSSSSFGHAYLTEGSVTRFFKEIISEYTVVFVGYAAEDPPVRYFLEALGENKKYDEDESEKIYAFHPGTLQEASERWDNKNVEAIAYDDDNAHAGLWDTLDAWAKRAKDTKAWQNSVIKMARKGPENLSPFEREQVAHLVSTKEGAERFYESNNPPPATWLCVFDRAIRFKTPTTITQKDGTETPVDYFKIYGLVSDPVPEDIDPDDPWARREVPLDAWDVFDINNQDNLALKDNSFGNMKGTQVLSVKNLPTRLYHLGVWIASVSDQNAAVWWAVRQAGIHPRVLDELRRALRNKPKTALHIKQAWQYLFDNWHPKPYDSRNHQTNWHSFKSDLDKFGWDTIMVRRYEDLTKPWMATCRNFAKNEIPPQKNVKTNFRELVDLEVSYNEQLYEIEIRDEWLAKVITAFKRNLDTAIGLEIERGYYPTIGTSIDPLDEQNASNPKITHGLADAVIYYTSLFQRLLEYKPQQAQAEAKTWDKEDSNIYARLRIWSCRFSEIIANDELADFFATMHKKVFWDFYHQRDLLHTLRARWTGMPDATKRVIEKRLLQGPAKRRYKKQKEHAEYSAWSVLERLDWLKNNGCDLSSVTEERIAELKETTPKYQPKHGQQADASRQSGVQIFGSNTEYSALLKMPASLILPKAQEIRSKNDHFMDDNDPFRGLCEAHPTRALSALYYEAKQGIFLPWAWAWQKFLHGEKRKEDSIRMKGLTAELIVRMPDEMIIEIMSGLGRWLLTASKELPPACVPIFEQLTKRLIKLLHDNHATENFAMKSSKTNRDWGTEALNRPAGDIAQALFNDPRKNGLKVGQPFPHEWLNLGESMLNLPDDQGRYALFIFMYNLRWFYDKDPQWAHTNLLQPLFDGNPDTVEAWWAGYRVGVPAFDLFQKIKPYLLERVANQEIQKRSHSNIMQELVLLNWGCKGKKRISNTEFRELLLKVDDNFRLRILWEFQSFCNEGENAHHWKNKRLTFFENVWPREKQIKTALTSERLIDFAFSDEAVFPRLTKAIIPLLGEIKQGHVFSILHGGEENRIIDKHPELVLEILFTVLPQNANQWPYDIEKVVDRIATADPELTRDPRFKELQRRWAAR